MLILIAVTVKTVIDSGLFGHAHNAVSRWAEEEQKELALLNQADNLITQYVPDNNSTPTPTVTPNIGDFVQYTPDSAQNYMGLTEATKSK